MPVVVWIGLGVLGLVAVASVAKSSAAATPVIPATTATGDTGGIIASASASVVPGSGIASADTSAGLLGEVPIIGGLFESIF